MRENAQHQRGADTVKWSESILKGRTEGYPVLFRNLALITEVPLRGAEPDRRIQQFTRVSTLSNERNIWHGLQLSHVRTVQLGHLEGELGPGSAFENTFSIR